MPFGTRNRTRVWEQSTGLAQGCRITTIECEFSKVLHENEILGDFNLDIDVLCVVQMWLLWYSAPIILNKDFLNVVCLQEIYNRVIGVALETSSHIPSSQTPKPK